MGFYDREYYRDDSASRHEPRGPWSVTAWLIGINAAAFVANLLFGGHDNVITYNLAAHPDTLMKPYLWFQVLTYGFAHDPVAINHILFNMFGLFCFGRAIEETYGPREFLRFYLVSVVLGGLFWCARAAMMVANGYDPDYTFLVGASGGITAVILLYCINFPKNTILLMMVLPVPAWFVGAGIILNDVLGAFFGSPGVAVDVHIVGAVFAIFYYKQHWQLTRWLPAFSIPSIGSLPKKLFSRKPRLRVHHASDDDSDVDDDVERQVDQLLEKINREGIDSLSNRERRMLEQHSRRMRERRG